MAERSQQEKDKKLKKERDVHTLVREADEEKAKARGQVLQQTGRKFYQTVLYYGLPLMGVAFFLGIVVFGTIPSIQGINDLYREKAEKQEEIEELDAEIASLEELTSREFSMRADLETIERIVPSEKSQVAKFVQEIAELAEKHGLEETEYYSGERVEPVDGEDDDTVQPEVESAAIIRIPSTSEYNAELEDIRNFLNDLYNKDDFIIVSFLDMRGYEGRLFQAERQEALGEDVAIPELPQTDWAMEVTFEKYQFSQSFTDYISENLVPISSEPNQETLEFIRERYAQ